MLERARLKAMINSVIENRVTEQYWLKLTFNFLKCVLFFRQDVDVSALKPSRPSRQHRHHPHHHHHPYNSDQRHLASGYQFPSYPFPPSYQSSVSNVVLFQSWALEGIAFIHRGGSLFGTVVTKVVSTDLVTQDQGSPIQSHCTNKDNLILFIV